MNDDIEERDSFERLAKSFRDSPHTQVHPEFPDKAKNRLHILRDALAKAPFPANDCPCLWIHSCAKEEWFCLEESIAIGSKETNDLQVTDEYVSGSHCRIEHRNSDYLLIDRNSTNGLYVNGERISRSILNDGDIIQVGKCTLIFVLPEPE